MVGMLLLDGDVFVSFDLALNWNHFYLFIGDHLFVILNAFLNGVEILLYHLSGDRLYHFTFFICDDLSLHGDFLDVGAIFILNHFFFIGDVAHPALTCLV